MPMKTKRISLAIALGLTVVVAAMLLLQHRLPDAKKETSPDVITGNASNSAPPVTSAAEEAKGRTNAANEEGYFKTITDPQSGEYVIASSDKQSVVLKDKNGKIIWSTNVAGWIKFPEHGSKEIWFIQLVTNQTGFPERCSNTVGVCVGRGSVFINIKTGEVIPGPMH
jgi:hypothetical protein